MNTFRKILTSTALAAVMAVSVSVGASAEKAESDINSVSMLQNSVTIDLNGVETVLSEAEFLELKDSVGKREYLYLTKEKSSSGSAGWVTISSGIYTITYNPSGNVFKKYYGVSAEIIGCDPNYIKSNTTITINADYYDNSNTYSYSRSEIANKLNIEILNDNFVAIHSVITTSSDGFGTSEQEVNSGWKS